MTWQIFVIGSSVFGILVSLRMLSTFKRGAKLFGAGTPCQAIAESSWGSIFYFRNEAVSIAAYVLMIVLVLLPYVLPGFSLIVFLSLLLVSFFLLLATFVMFYVEQFILKKWCAWYLFAGILNIVIFLLASSDLWYLP